MEKRRLAQIREVEEQRKNKKSKLEEAETRRLKLLEEKRKHVEELNKEKVFVSERKKSQVIREISRIQYIFSIILKNIIKQA